MLRGLRAILVLAVVMVAGWTGTSQAQYMYLDSNGDGVSTAADRLNDNGIATNVEVYLNTNHNRSGSLAVCNTADGNLTINSYVVNLAARNGTVLFTNVVNLKSLFTIVTVPLLTTSTALTVGQASGSAEAAGLHRLMSVSVTGLIGTPSIDVVAQSILSLDGTSFGTLCSGNDFDNTYKLGLDWFDVDGLRPAGATNAEPRINVAATVNGSENTAIAITASASDPDAGQLVTLSQTNNAPFLTGPATAGPATGPSLTLNGTPNFFQAGTYTINWSATDNSSPTPATVTTSTSVVIGDVDRVPVLTVPVSQTGAEGALLTFTVSASDPDGDAITSLSVRGTAIDFGGVFTTNASKTSGTFSWTPGYSQANTYSAIFTAVSNGLSSTATTSVIVTNTDRAPVVTAPATQTATPGTLLAFVVLASEPDSQAITSLVAAPLPTGATFTTNAAKTSGTFSWTPSASQAGTYAVTFTASNTLSGSATTNISVADRAPVVSAPATATGAENAPISLTATASDPDGQAIATLTAAPLPTGATFTANAAKTSGTFSWTPSYTQAGSYSVTFTASNALSGSATTAITVTNVDRAPSVTAPATASGAEGSALSVTVTTSDPDADAIASLTASGTAITAGATFTANASNTSGTLSWTPSYTQSGSYGATFTASNGLSGSATTAITIANTNRAPVVTAPATASGAEGSALAVTVTASDADGDAITTLTAAPLPAGATFAANATNTSGTLNWTPSYTQSGSYNVTFTAANALSGSAATAITIANTDRAPSVTAPATASGAEGSALSVTVTASDPDADAIASLTASGTAVTAGATFTANASNTSGTLSWTPSSTQSGSYGVTFTASNALSGSATTAITIANVERAPVVTAPATASGAEGSALSVTVTASDPDADAIASLTASGTAITAGATFTADASNTSGLLTWTPSYTQSGSYSVTFTASNALSGSATTAITIANTDRAPAVTAPATQSGSTGALVTFTVSASDPDGQAITTLTGAPLPSGATFTKNAANTSGTFSWTPVQTGTFAVTFTASNGLSGTATTNITVTSGDRAPVVAAPATATGAEGSALSVTVTASDPDANAITSLTASGSAVTAGATFTTNASNTSGTLSWTPSYTQAGSYGVTFTAVNALSASATTAITVTNVDRAPVVTAPATASGSENTALSVIVTASDPDGDPITSLTAAPLPAGATFTANASNTSGTLSWTPTFTQSGSYNVTFTAIDGSSASSTTAITIANTDRAPIVSAPATASGAEGSALTVITTAADPDGEAIASLSAAGTAMFGGATFTKNASNTSGTLSWTPSFNQAGTFNVIFTASNALSGSATTVITIANTDRAPSVTAPATANGAQGTALSVTVTASDPDAEAIASLTASGTAITAGATFAANASNTSGTLSWTPTFSQSGSYSATFTASNALSGSATTAITINASDRAPSVAAPATASGAEGTGLQVVVTASDADGNTIASLTASGTAVTAGATFTANASNTSGTLNWTPSFTQSGSYSVTFTASNALSGSATTTITIANTDRAPSVTAPATASGAEGSALSVTVTASDPDADAIASLTASGTAVTAGATFTANASKTSGTLSWTPSFTQAGSYSVTFTASNALSGSATTAITVTNTDRAPSVTASASASGAEGSALSVTVTASDPDADAIASLTASGTVMTAGATFTANASNTSGTLTWTPSYTQSGSYSVTFTASNALSGSASTAITITNTDRAPVVTAPANASGVEGTPLSVTVTASDPDADAIASLTASGTAVTAGATFTANASNTSGTLSWTPTFTGTYSATFTASNGLSGSATTSISVANVDRAPVVAAPATQSALAGTLVTFSVTASDPDGDAIASLTAAGLPSGATFTANVSNTAGTFSWTPTAGQVGSVTVTFTASNALSGSAATMITVVANQTPTIAAPATSAGSEGVLLSFGVTATDPDGDRVTLTAPVKPMGSTFTDNGNSTGTFNWTPTFTQAGSHTVTFVGNDGRGGTTSTSTIITIANVNRAPVASAGGPYSGMVNSPVSFNGSASSDPDVDPLTYAWTFGDGSAPGSGATTTHTYLTGGVYRVVLQVSDGFLSATDSTTATISSSLPAFAFTTGGYDTTVTATGKPYTCVQVQPVSGSFLLSDVILSSVKMISIGTGVVSEITADASKATVDSDKNKDGIGEITACFAKTDLRQLFSYLPAGTNIVVVTIQGSLANGLIFRAQLTHGVVKSTGGLMAMSISPNPLNPRAKVTFATSRAGAVRIQMFDPQGRLVRTIANGTELEAGRHEFDIDGKSVNGTKLASGVYFVKVWSQYDGQEVKSITILK